MDSGRYGETISHKVLHDNMTIEKVRGYEQYHIEKHKTKTGIIGEETSSENRGNKINSFDKNRTDKRGKKFKEKHEKIVEETINKKGCKS